MISRSVPFLCLAVVLFCLTYIGKGLYTQGVNASQVIISCAMGLSVFLSIFAFLRASHVKYIFGKIGAAVYTAVPVVFFWSKTGAEYNDFKWAVVLMIATIALMYTALGGPGGSVFDGIFDETKTKRNRSFSKKKNKKPNYQEQRSAQYQGQKREKFPNFEQPGANLF